MSTSSLDSLKLVGSFQRHLPFFSLPVRINLSFPDFCHKYFLKGAISKLRYKRKCSDSQITSHFVIVLFAISVWYLLPVCFLLSAIPVWYLLQISSDVATAVEISHASYRSSLPAREEFLRFDESGEDTFPLHVRRDDILLRTLSFIKE